MPKQTYFKLSEAKRKQIEAVAIDEFTAHSYEAASISSMVAQAGIAKGSFYQYFDGKEDLFMHLLKLANQKKGELVKELKPAERAMDTFDYLRWMLQLQFLFEIRFPKLAKITFRAFTEGLPFLEDEDNNDHRGGSFYFNDFLAQGILHEDVATWVDTHLTSFVLGTLYHHFGSYLLKRMQLNAEDFAEGKLDIFSDQLVQDLFDNLMDILKAGIAREPEIRREFYSK